MTEAQEPETQHEPAVAEPVPARPLEVGELIMLIDRKERRYLTTLVEGGEFHSHAGAVPHENMIGHAEGQEFRTAKNAAYLVMRPTLSDFILKMKRGAKVLWINDLGPARHLKNMIAKRWS